MPAACGATASATGSHDVHPFVARTASLHPTLQPVHSIHGRRSAPRCPPTARRICCSPPAPSTFALKPLIRAIIRTTPSLDQNIPNLSRFRSQSGACIPKAESAPTLHRKKITVGVGAARSGPSQVSRRERSTAGCAMYISIHYTLILSRTHR